MSQLGQQCWHPTVPFEDDHTFREFNLARVLAEMRLTRQRVVLLQHLAQTFEQLI